MCERRWQCVRPFLTQDVSTRATARATARAACDMQRTVLPPNEFRSSCVSLLDRYGMCVCPRPFLLLASASMTDARDSSERLMRRASF